jgi:hypothetical protein
VRNEGYLSGPASRRIKPTPEQEGDVIELLSNNWDDFGYQTSFPVTCRIDGEAHDLELIRLLIEDANTSSLVLDRLLVKHWMRIAQKRTVEETWKFLGKLIHTITTAQCQNYIQNAGYASINS